ncbi:MAG: hypothetical protein LBD60_04330 [Puniceicoccales bacterium]|jgi:hypothetical protein|nr:hypothetical protein [Puniceicoccales bacterium]
MTRKIDYLSFIGFCGVIFSGDSDLYAALEYSLKEIRKLELMQGFYDDQTREKIYIDHETGRFGPLETFLVTDPETGRLVPSEKFFVINPKTGRLIPLKAFFVIDPETEQFVLRETFFATAPKTEQFVPPKAFSYPNSATERLYPQKIFLGTAFKTKQLYAAFQRRQRRQLDLEQNPFREDPDSGTLFREVTIGSDKGPKTFVEQTRPDGGIFRWEMTIGNSPIFTPKLPDGCSQKANDELVMEQIMSCIGNRNLAGLKRILDQLDNPEFFIDRNPDLLHRVKAEIACTFSGNDTEINQTIVKILTEFGYYDFDNELD